MAKSVLSNPPFNMRWKHPPLIGMLPEYAGYLTPPESNANYAFILKAWYESDDRAVLILPCGVLSTTQKQEEQIRKQLIAENAIRAVIACPERMFESTSIAVCLLVLDHHKDTKKICFVDLRNHCETEIRDQNGQFGGNSHTGRTYHKEVSVIPDEVIQKAVSAVNGMSDIEGFSKCTADIVDANLTPSRYIDAPQVEVERRSYADMAADYNRIIRQKNAIKIRMNKTAAKRLGFDCLDVERPDISKSFEITGQKAEKEDFITFSANDGIDIHISTKEGVHMLIREFLKGWKLMIMYLNEEENRILAEYRDALMIDLLSGKIDVGEDNANNPD